jgi:aryl-alcohol dehydrogenase-like predicted oxidoreductase
VAFAIAWMLANPLVTATLAGPRTPEQRRSYLVALDMEITRDDDAAIDGLVKPGTAAIPHHIDPSSPPEGRPAASRASEAITP